MKQGPLPAGWGSSSWAGDGRETAEPHWAVRKANPRHSIPSSSHFLQAWVRSLWGNRRVSVFVASRKKTGVECTTQRRQAFLESLHSLGSPGEGCTQNEERSPLVSRRSPISLIPVSGARALGPAFGCREWELRVKTR